MPRRSAKGGNMKSIVRFIRIFLLFIPASVYAQENCETPENIEAPFNVNKIIESVSHHLPPSEYIGRLENAAYTRNNYSELRTGEFLIDTSIVYVPVKAIKNFPAIASDGDNFLIVWEDRRNGVTNIYGARVNQYGEILDPTGIAISTGSFTMHYPSVAFDGTNYLVVWQDDRDGWDIYGARVDQAGQVLDPDGIAISTATGYQWASAIAFDGANYLVVWQDDRNGWDIYGARVDQTGQVLDPNGIAISTSNNTQLEPAIACNGTYCLVVWEDRRNGLDADIYGTRVNQAGQVLDPGGIAISTANNTQREPQIASNSTNYLIIWEDNPGNIYGARVDSSGILLDSLGIAISTGTYDEGVPSVSFDGMNFLVAWEDIRNGNNDIYGTRVNQSGVVLDPNGIPISTAEFDQRYPVVAFGGTYYLVVWLHHLSTYYDNVYGARVHQSGTVLDPNGIIISTIANAQYACSNAFDGTNYLVVWQDDRSGRYFDIYGARITQQGSILDSIPISISIEAYDQKSPSVAYGDTNYFVVWIDRREGWYEIYGARISQGGELLDTNGIKISTSTDIQESPSVTFDGTNYLVVWEDHLDIYGARVSQTGTVIDTIAKPISTCAFYEKCPSVAFDGTNYLVIWEDMRNGYDDIYGARVTQTVEVLDSTGIAISTEGGYQQHPTASFGETNFFVVWQDDDTYGHWNIYGARVSSAGMVLDTLGIPIATAEVSQSLPSVAFDGNDYVIAWQDSCNDLSSDIYGAKVNQSGLVIDSFNISLQTGEQTSPVLIHGTDNQILITYSGWTDSINARPANTMRIWGKFYPFTGIEEDVEFRIQNTEFCLQVFPNPFSRLTEIRYQVPDIQMQDARNKMQDISLKIYDVSGRIVKVFNLTSGFLLPASTISWNGVDNTGQKLSSGVYFCCLKAGDLITTTKIIKLK